MKLWIDDTRMPPDDSWLWAKTYESAIGFLGTCPIEDVSFDHDLGTEKDGNDILMWLLNECRDKNFIGPKIIGIHTQNVSEKFKMIATAQQVEGVEYVTAETPEGKRF